MDGLTSVCKSLADSAWRVWRQPIWTVNNAQQNDGNGQK